MGERLPDPIFESPTVATRQISKSAAPQEIYEALEVLGESREGTSCHRRFLGLCFGLLLCRHLKPNELF
jgi:hypothetical protein